MLSIAHNLAIYMYISRQVKWQKRRHGNKKGNKPEKRQHKRHRTGACINLVKTPGRIKGGQTKGETTGEEIISKTRILNAMKKGRMFEIWQSGREGL